MRTTGELVQRRIGAVLSALLLAVGVLSAAVATPSAVAAGESDVLVAQTATLARPAGFPAPGTPSHHQLASARVDIEVFGAQRGTPTYHVDAHVDMAAAAPDEGPDAALFLFLGHYSGNECVPASSQRELIESHKGTSYHLFGYTPDYFASPATPWDCVVIAVASTVGATMYDVMVAPLTNTYHAPAISITGVELLGREAKQLKLVRSSWYDLEVEVANSGQIGSGPLVLSGRGKGLKVRSVDLEGVAQGSTSTATLRVKLTGKKRTRLRLSATAPGIDASRTLRVRAVPPPARPRAGTYRSKDGSVTFKVRNGRVRAFSATGRTQCGGYGSVPTYTQNTYDFPTTKVPRNGIVTASDNGTASGAAWSTYLEMRIAGGKVTQGYFRYFVASGPCEAVVTFTARRRR